ncbi:hypothetical protein BpHYR1_033698 [Brachionus plicatilis]|uniref:Uncharacterized protein n=1 Tax=Brachionus plicatilis TaxID=10195 RepID=A0A3M7SKF2_BRAPC|nr:hypothetical protein BpHYR1_033698 [Brachionus plicatilis]
MIISGGVQKKTKPSQFSLPKQHPRILSISDFYPDKYLIQFELVMHISDSCFDWEEFDVSKNFVLEFLKI